jgi:NTP pyrophosphatase (non-canonical NTP hydrolase)
MQNGQYIKEALVTESADPTPIKDRLGHSYRLVHAGMGLTTETAELVDALKKWAFYGKPLDKVNIKEEVGDVFWYLAIVADECGFTFEEAMETNIKRLRKRYGDKFTEFDANNRNLIAERAILEQKN